MLKRAHQSVRRADKHTLNYIRYRRVSQAGLTMKLRDLATPILCALKKLTAIEEEKESF